LRQRQRYLRRRRCPAVPARRHTERSRGRSPRREARVSFSWEVLLGGLEEPLRVLDIKRVPRELSNAIKCLLTKPSRRRAAASAYVRLSWPAADAVPPY